MSKAAVLLHCVWLSPCVLTHVLDWYLGIFSRPLLSSVLPRALYFRYAPRGAIIRRRTLGVPDVSNVLVFLSPPEAPLTVVFRRQE